MPKHYEKEMSLEELRYLQDQEIDTSDIPDMEETFGAKADVVEPEGTEQITLCVKKSVLQAHSSTGKGYQTRMNAVLESYARTLDRWEPQSSSLVLSPGTW
ncbi:MAG: BrnA antitoxin family protein [Shinella sp.]|jgi:uncharacterized protein (DUF4415 family)|nr:BrnA antitoxin family protein [Shinella sp.]